MIGRGTTTTKTYDLSPIPVADIAECYFTLRQGRVEIEKNMADAEALDEYTLAWTLSQEETLKLRDDDVAEHQIRYKTIGGEAYESTITLEPVYRVLKEGVI